MEQATSCSTSTPQQRAAELRDAVVQRISLFVRMFGSDRLSIEAAYWALQPAWDVLFSVYARVCTDTPLLDAVNTLTHKQDDMRYAQDALKTSAERYRDLCKKYRDVNEMTKLSRLLTEAGQRAYDAAGILAHSNRVDGYNDDGTRRV